jgi:hypothetical protein
MYIEYRYKDFLSIHFYSQIKHARFSADSAAAHAASAMVIFPVVIAPYM